jgi:2-polyprenyl-3-methyl-5-hydroxy-6-metoxy-1,4-benzoquinol methylase
MCNVLITALVLCLVCLLQAQAPRPPLPSDRRVWNDTYAEMIRDDESFLPNAFLIKVVEGRKPRTALDMAMGQGRNALMLAQRGWDVTGFDISDLAVD